MWAHPWANECGDQRIAFESQVSPFTMQTEDSAQVFRHGGLPSESPCWPRIILFYHFSYDCLKVSFLSYLWLEGVGTRDILLVATSQCLETHSTALQRQDSWRCSASSSRLSLYYTHLHGQCLPAAGEGTGHPWNPSLGPFFSSFSSAGF